MNHTSRVNGVLERLIDKINDECALVALFFGILFLGVVKMAFRFASEVSRQGREFNREREEGQR